MDEFMDKVAIVTGGASGLGLALCEELARRGAQVVVADIDVDRAHAVATDITRRGGRARAMAVDVTEAARVQEVVDETVSAYGVLDFMFNNAGILLVGEACDMSLEHWRRVLDVNLVGVGYGTLAAYAVMVKQRSGHIVNTGSLMGLIPVGSTVAYAGAKHGVVGLSTSLRAEGAAFGVKVTVVCPGSMQTPIYGNATVLRARREDLYQLMPFKPIDPVRAARSILKGVVRNQAIVTFPWYIRLSWWLGRIHPAIGDRIGRAAIRRFRAIRHGE